MVIAAGLRSAYRTAVHQAWRYNSAWATASKAAADAATARCTNAGSSQTAWSQYAKQLRSKKQSAHEAIRARLKPRLSLLDFSPRFQYRRFNPTSTRSREPWAWGKRRAPFRAHPRQPCNDLHGQQSKLRMLLLEAYAGRSLRHTPQSCPAHGRARTSPWCGGTGGHHKWRQWRSQHQRAHRQRMRMHRTRDRACPLELATWFLDRQLDRGCRKIRHLNKLAPVTSDHSQHGTNAGNDHASSTSYRTSRSSLHSYPATNSGFLKPRGFQPRPGVTLLAGPPWATSHSFAKVAPHLNLGICRLFSSSSSRKGPEVLLKAALLLKSANALQLINILFRVSVSFIPLSIKRASWARKARLAQLATGAAIATPYWATFLKYLCRGALALPFVLLVAVLLAAIERTPITGRLRLLLLNQEEERDIVTKVLEIGATETSAAGSIQEQRDWISIMRAVLGEESAPEGTLLGGKVLNPSDGRVHLVQRVLDKLEHGVPALNLARADSSLEIEPPNLAYPLKDSARCSHIQSHNAVLVIDRPESNAFSFGFYGSVDKPQPGVIIVFTGAIDEIMSVGPHGNTKNPARSLTNLQEDIAHEGVHEPSWLRSFFGSILSPAQAEHQHRRISIPSITQEQEEGLAVLLAHELAHLVLSHTIESYANTALLWPQLEKLGWDMLRAFIYPVTAILGPFVQDAISATVKVGIEESAQGRGLLPALTSSCESKKMEFEADTVALRLLANAGIDPRSAVHFWEERLFKQGHSHNQTNHDGHQHGGDDQLRSEVRHMHEVHSDNDAETQSFIKTHPADQERITAIKKELASWHTVSRLSPTAA